MFAANFIRWASHWLQAQAQPAANALNVRKLGVKRQVYVAAHVSAQVTQDSGLLNSKKCLSSVSSVGEHLGSPLL